MSSGSYHLTVHGTLPPEATARIDAELGHYNEGNAPLAEVQSLACIAHDAKGLMVGGAVGRTWGACAELQQLWVSETWRKKGVATDLLRNFEGAASARNCTLVYLETFSFQAPDLYRQLGYAVRHEIQGFPEQITKYLMLKRLDTK
jgi:GNAT superfamily N-acetyltransferase